MEIINQLKDLCDLRGPSGFEEIPVAKAVELLKEVMDEAYVDRFGNAVGVLRCGKKNAKKILLDAHLDEIGFIVSGYDKGFLRFEGLGGADPRMLPDREVVIMTEPPMFGVITCQPPHVLSAAEMNKAFDRADLRIDAGLSEGKAEKLIPIGTPVTFRTEGFKLGKTLYCGKSIDDRGCFMILLEAAKLLKGKDFNWDVYIIGSKFEETGGQGALTGTFAINPDECIAVDVTHGKTPDGGRDNSDIAISEGAAIGIGPNSSKYIAKAMMEIGDVKGIPYQVEVIEGNSWTNGWEMQTTREGIPTLVMSLPLKYMHTPYEVIDTEDVKTSAELLAEYILSKEA